MYDRVNDIVEFLHVIDKMDLASFLYNNGTSIFIVVSTMHTIKEVMNWELFMKT
jgi:hypothetical protein